MRLESQTVARLDVLRGGTSSDVDSLSQLVLDNSSTSITNDETDTYNEDSYCPPSPIVDYIIEEIIESFKETTRMDIVARNYWGHIHKKNMSTNIHKHSPHFLASVVYLSVPQGSGSIIFHPYGYNNDHKGIIEPEKSMFLLFPGWLEHSVTRNKSDDSRVSLSFNFDLLSKD